MTSTAGTSSAGGPSAGGTSSGGTSAGRPSAGRPSGAGSTAAEAFLAAHRAATAAADRIDDRHRRRSPHALAPGHPGAVATAWGLLRLVAIVLALPVLGPLVAALAAWRTRRVQALAERYPTLVHDLADGRDPGAAFADLPDVRTSRLPAGARWFVSSDLHRCVPGTVDWPGHQETLALYEVALGHYADEGWGLIENGDVEDLWLVGGSTYGVTYDVARLVAHAWRGPNGARVRGALAVEHLRRIVAHNRRVYDLIDERFHRPGRYHRTVGNHDDALHDPAVAAELRRVHPGLAAWDFLVLEAGGDGDTTRGRGVGVVTHGHHTDGWNAPGHSALGKLGTWLGSAAIDTPKLANPGVPDEEETARLLAGDAPNLLTRVGRRFGANRELYSLDEVLLHEAWRRHWPEPADAPWLLLGHTHVPLVDAVDPTTGNRWTRYANSGAGIFRGCLTGIEWDGTDDPRDPVVRLVVWRYADLAPERDGDDVVGRVGGRAVVREVLEGVDGRLRVHDASAVRA